MSFRGGRPRDFRGSRGRGGGFTRGFTGPPSSTIEAGYLLHSCESMLVVRSCLDKQVPYFNGRIFLENKQEIGKVDEILGPINNFFFSIKLNDNIKSTSFLPNTKFYVDQQQLLPLSRFLPKPATTPSGVSDSAKTNKGGMKGSISGFSRGRGSANFRGQRGQSFGRGNQSRGSFRGLRRGISPRGKF